MSYDEHKEARLELDEAKAENDRIWAEVEKHLSTIEQLRANLRDAREDYEALRRDAVVEAEAYRRLFAERDALRAQVERVDIAGMARRFSLWLNSTYPPDLDTEALHWRRVSKVSEEAGEVREALGAWFHENPRKPAGTVEDVVKELADCVGAALGAIEHLTGHEGRSLDIAAERVRFVCERVGLSSSEPVTAGPRPRHGPACGCTPCVAAYAAGEVTPPAEQRADDDGERLWQIGLYGSDLDWFKETGHCGHCGDAPDSCTCTDADPCGCREAHPARPTTEGGQP